MKDTSSRKVTKNDAQLSFFPEETVPVEKPKRRGKNRLSERTEVLEERVTGLEAEMTLLREQLELEDEEDDEYGEA